MNPLYIDTTSNETVTFDANSVFDVRIADGKNDMIVIQDSEVGITNGATVKAYFDFRNMTTLQNGSYFEIIDDVAGNIDNDSGVFTVEQNLPRGWEVTNEWDEKMLGGVPKHGSWLVLNWNWQNGYGRIPGGSHNETETGKIIDIINQNPTAVPPPLQDLVDHVNEADREANDDGVSRRMLKQLDGDLAANAFFLAFKEPWRHPFNRLSFADSPCESADDQAFRDGVRPRVWAEFTSRYESTRDDGNAFDFNVRRHGVALGMDRLFSPGLIAGATFQYSNPELRQDTGTVNADDFEFGLYGIARLMAGFEAKAYLGYSRQFYDFDRSVFLPATSTYPALNEHLEGRTKGDTLSASVEFTRPVDLRPGIRLLPTAAVDYEKAWMKGYVESGGAAALDYDNASAERLTLRVGVTGEFCFLNRHTLKARAQYGRHLLGDRQPAIGASFALAPKGALPNADIWSVQIGRDYLNLGVGAEFKAGRRDNVSIYVNYDAKLYRRETIHAGEAGISIAF